MLNVCVFRGFIDLAKVKLKKVNRKNFKTGKQEEIEAYDFTLFFNTGKKDRDGKAIYATFFLTTFSTFSMDDFDALIESKGRGEKVGAIVNLNYIPYKREVFYDKSGESKLIDVPQWNVVSLEFLEFIEKDGNGNKSKGSSNKTKYKDEEDEDLVDGGDDDAVEEVVRPKKKNSNGKATRPNKANVKKQTQEDEESYEIDEDGDEDEYVAPKKKTKPNSKKPKKKVVIEEEDDDYDYDDEDLEDFEDGDMA